MEPSLPLDYEQKNPPPRPTITDKLVKELAAAKAAQAIMDANWWQDEIEDLNWIDDIEDCLDKQDGYKMCRRLESRYGWDPDSELVEILDHPWFLMAVTDAVKEWVEINGIKPKLALGTIVSAGKTVGPISKIYEKDGCYAIETSKGRSSLIAYELVSVVSD